MDYHEDALLTDYVWDQCYPYMTPFELMGRKTVHAQTKANSESNERRKRMILDKFGAGNDPEVIAALSRGPEAFRIVVRDRVLRDHPELVNRCPKCSRLARTPRAKQCRWCFHEWRSQG